MTPSNPTEPSAPIQRSLSIYLDRRMIVILLLGFSSGLPFALSFTTLSVWFAEVGVRKTDIGLFVLAGSPYGWKFLWAPLLDGMRIPFLTRRLGQRRSWALASQVGLMGSLVWLGSLDPTRELGLMAAAAIVVVFMAATQDVVIDAYRIEILRDDEQGAGSAMTTYGYRFGMLASGAGALYLSDHMSWFAVYAIEAALLVIGMVTVLVAGEPTSLRGSALAASSAETEQAGLAATGVEAGAVPIVPGPMGSGSAAGGGPARRLREILVDPFADFLRRPWWALILGFVVLYRFPDSFLSVMANVFYKDLGFSNSDIASVSKIFGTVATLVGVFLGGLVVHRMGVLKSLLVCGVVQLLSNLMYITMAQRPLDVAVFAATIAVENVSGGMTGVAFIAYLSSLCSRGFAGSQYALLSALGLFTRNSLSAASGWLAETVGWSWFFVVSALVGIPGMALLAFFLLSGRFDPPPAERPASGA